MDSETYSAKEAMKILNMSSSTFYRKVKKGEIPYEAGRPMRFPKVAIHALADSEPKEDENNNLTFKLSTVADMWTKYKSIKDANTNEDMIPFKSVAAWRRKNEKISKCVEEEKTVLGWTVFLPLKARTISKLIEGKMKESNIPAKAVKQWSDEKISVYIPILEVFPTSNTARDKRVAAILIRNTIEWALTLSNQGDIHAWYAIVSRSKGKKLVEKLGFEQINTLDDGERECYKLERDSPLSQLLGKFSRKQQELLKQQKLLKRQP